MCSDTQCRLVPQQQRCETCCRALSRGRGCDRFLALSSATLATFSSPLSRSSLSRAESEISGNRAGMVAVVVIRAVKKATRDRVDGVPPRLNCYNRGQCAGNNLFGVSRRARKRRGATMPGVSTGMGISNPTQLVAINRQPVGPHGTMARSSDPPERRATA